MCRRCCKRRQQGTCTHMEEAGVVVEKMELVEAMKLVGGTQEMPVLG